MPVPRRVLRSDDPAAATLLEGGWKVIARSWGAGLRSSRIDVSRIAAAAAVDGVVVRELTPDDVAAVLALDAATIDDYPGGIATAHAPLTTQSATPRPDRRAWGAFAGPELLAMTYVDVAGQHAETDFTVVAPGWRRRGLGTAVKAASLVALVADGVQTFRTGGSSENAGSIAANRALGYELDEEWWTLAAPRRPGDGCDEPA